MIGQFYLTHTLALTGTDTPDQRGPKSNSNEGVHYIPQISGLEPHYQIKFSVIPGDK